jgi:hypothetical protein
MATSRPGGKNKTSSLPFRDCVIMEKSDENSKKRDGQMDEKALERNL